MKKRLKNCKIYSNGVCIGIADIELPELKLSPIVLAEDIALLVDHEKQRDARRKGPPQTASPQAGPGLD